LARRLRQLADADGGPSPGSMVVLLRASTHVRAYEEALERAGLNPYVVGGRGYWSHQQVEDPLRLLAVIANPLDDEALFGALSSPASAASADSLWILRQLSKRREPIWPALQRHFGAEPAQDLREEEQRWTAAMPKADEERLRRFVHRIELLRAEAPRLGLEELTERVTSAFDYDLATLLRPGGARRMANLRKLMRLAREFEEDEGRDLRGFLTHAETRAGREDRESEAATEAEGHDGVRLMTIHNAKGLEFDVVAVADLGRDLLSGSRASAIQLGEPRISGEGEGEDALRVGVKVARLGQDNLPLYDYGELAEERKLRDEGEELRLAYVAATRARERLILSGWGKLDKLDPAAPVTPRSSIIARLLPALGVRAEEGETVHVPPPPALPGVEPREAEVQIPVTVSYPTAKAARELSQRREELAPPSAEVAGPTPPIAPLDPPPEPLASRLSYSALAQYERCPYRFYVERGLGLGRREETASANGDGDEAVPARELRYGVGSAVHELLEWSARNAWTRPDDDRARGALARAGIEPDAEHVAHAAAMVDRWLTSDLCRGLQGDGTAARAEVPFLLPLCGTILRGSIDLLSGPRDGEALVVDYKTDSLEDRDPAEAMTEYERQRDLYALAAAAAGAKRVRTAYFFCDEPGTALEMTYDAAELEAARGRLGELIARVAAGDFEPTPQPHRRLCAGCPAQERLCSWDKSMTMRDAPE
jgi:ATP-dependent exoDNAse (exonuclease V) beta subunit